MKIDKDSVVIGAICLIFIWLMVISFAIVDLYAYKEFVLENICDIYDMITDVYHHITNLLKMEVLI